MQLAYPSSPKQNATEGAVEIENLTARSLNAADLCVYNIGNDSRFHAEILGCSLVHPGVVVMHDRAINELLLARSRQSDQAAFAAGGQPYLAAMAEWYGQSGVQAAHAVLRGSSRAVDVAPECPLFEVVLSQALGVVCHNPAFAREIRAAFPRLPVLELPLPYPLPGEHRAPVVASPRDGRIRLSAFGFLGQNRRIAEFLEVWGSLPEKDRFVLDLAGELADPDALASLARANGLAEQVRFHGFLPERELDRMIAESHLVLNLRYPSMGEASGSQLRIWANRAASAVTDTGWYSALPDGCVYKIDPAQEAVSIRTMLDDLLTGKIDLDAMAECGQALLTRHDPESYAEQLVAWIDATFDPMREVWADNALISAVAYATAACMPLNSLPILPSSLLRR